MSSHDIADYFEASFGSLRAGDEITFDIHLYFKRNDRIIVWKKKGEILSPAFLDQYRSRGVNRIWIRNSERELYDKYADANGLTPAQETAETIRSFLGDPDLDDRKKKALIAKESRRMLSQITSSISIEDQKKKNREAQEAAADLLADLLKTAQSISGQIWDLAQADEDLGHAVNVATLTVFFALAFGRIEPELISDLALAGLLHDIGLTQISPRIASTPWEKMSDSDLKEYSQHIKKGMELLELYGHQIPERVKLIVQQHHEKNDGTGFPNHLKAVEFDGLAQLLSLADWLDSAMLGYIDGNQRTLREALELIEQVQSQPDSTNEYFSPEIFTAVVRWIKDPNSVKKGAQMTKVVQQKSMQIVGKVG